MPQVVDQADLDGVDSNRRDQQLDHDFMDKLIEFIATKSSLP